jgi:hypothetical protein
MGKLENTTAGTYLIRRAKSADSVGFEANTNGSDYAGFINFPTAYGLVLPRILLFNHSDADLDAIHAIQSQIKLEEIRRPGSSCIPSLTVELLGDKVLETMATALPTKLNDTSIKQLLEVTARVASYNPPIDPQDVPTVTANLAAAGLSHGRYSPPAGVNATLVALMVGKGLEDSLELQESFGNGWEDFLPQYSGNFREQFGIRAMIAYIGYLQLVPELCVYPQWDVEGDGFSLEANQAYVVTFPSGKPVVEGFWSMTAYNSTSYLIDNDLDVYSLGDRSNITYPDGSLVYGGDDDSRNDAFSLLIQPADIAPPSNWTSNWLPAPPGGGNFTVNCMYHPISTPFNHIFSLLTVKKCVSTAQLTHCWLEVRMSTRWLLSRTPSPSRVWFVPDRRVELHPT